MTLLVLIVIEITGIVARSLGNVEGYKWIFAITTVDGWLVGLLIGCLMGLISGCKMGSFFFSVSYPLSIKQVG